METKVVDELSEKTSTIHVIDDNPAVRDSLRVLLKTAGYKVRTYESARSFLEEPERVEEDCIVTDVRMPEMTGIDLIEALKARRETLPIILISGHADVPLAVQAMKLGAVDLLEKPFDDEALLASIHAALSSTRSNQSRKDKAMQIQHRMKSLSKRENEVLSGLLKGKSNKAIANELNLSARTIEVHRASLMEKMGAESLPELVQMVMTAERVDN